MLGNLPPVIYAESASLIGGRINGQESLVFETKFGFVSHGQLPSDGIALRYKES